MKYKIIYNLLGGSIWNNEFKKRISSLDNKLGHL